MYIVNDACAVSHDTWWSDSSLTPHANAYFPMVSYHETDWAPDAACLRDESLAKCMRVLTHQALGAYSTMVAMASLGRMLRCGEDLT